MVRSIVVIGTLLIVSAAAVAQDPQIVGWRRDGTGRYPQATPPTRWGIDSPAVRELSAQAAKPGEGETGKPIPGGVIRDWLLLVDYAGALDSQDKQLAASEPTGNDKVGELSWKAIHADTSTLDINQFTDKSKRDKQSTAYAHAYFYSPSGKPIALHAMWDGLSTAWVNGEQVFKASAGQTQASRQDLKIVKGWNRILVKVKAGGTSFKHLDPNWYCRMDLYGTDQKQLEKTNIRWSLPVHGTGISSPIIVGDKLFLTEENNTLTCVDKLTGKVLWRKTTTYADGATEKEKTDNPELFKEIDPLLAKIKELNAANSSATRDIEKDINRLMRKVDREKYCLPGPGDGGASAPTPTSDGKHIYTLNALGILSCFDLEGNRKWVSILQFKTGEHGAASSPLLIDGKLVVFYIHWDHDMPSIVNGIDATDGKVLWNFNKEIRVSYHCSPVGFNFSNEPCFATPVWVGKAKTGEILFDRGGLGREPTVISSAIAAGDELISYIDGGLDIVKLAPPPAKATVRRVPISVAAFPHWYGAWSISSPVYHEGLVYCVSEDGVLTVVDLKEGKVLYQKFLDLGLHMHHNLYTSRGGAGSSITLAGKYIYVFGNAGVGLVLEPGREYKQVAKNRIENFLPRSATHDYGHQETFGSCPVFEDRRMYLAAESNLYCIEQ